MSGLPEIAAVAADAKPLTLQIRWRNGDESRIDVSALVNAFRVYAPLRNSPECFGRVQLGEFGTDVVWADDIDISADTLWRLAQEQAGAATLKSAIAKGLADMEAGRIKPFDCKENIARGRELLTARHKSMD
jgi:hypothetical protein